MNCRKCHAPMVKRVARGSGNAFWGCTAYPACNHTEPYVDIGRPYIIEDRQQEREQIDKLKKRLQALKNA